MNFHVQVFVWTKIFTSLGWIATVPMLHCRAVVYLVLLQTAKLIPEWLCHFIFSPAMCVWLGFSTASLEILVPLFLFGTILIEAWWYLIVAMAPHSSTLAWKLPWTEDPGRLQSMGSLRVGHDWATSLSLFTFMHLVHERNALREGNGNPLQCSCLENPRDRGAWWAAVYGVAQSRTRLKWCSSSNSSYNI